MTGSPVSANAARTPVSTGRWLGAVILYTWTPFVLVGFSAPRGLGLVWDLGMLCGLSALAGFALMPVLTVRARSLDTGERWMPRLVQRLHNDLSWWLAALLVCHVAVSLILEPLTLEYLTWRGSTPMLAGLLALVAAGLLFGLSLPVMRPWAGSPRVWRNTHSALSLVLMLGSAWHVVGAGYYVRGVGPQVALAWLCAVPLLLVGVWRLRGQGPARSVPAAQHRSPDRLQATRAFKRARVIVLLAWSLALIQGVVIPRWAPPLANASPCAVEPCL